VRIGILRKNLSLHTRVSAIDGLLCRSPPVLMLGPGVSVHSTLTRGKLPLVWHALLARHVQCVSYVLSASCSGFLSRSGSVKCAKCAKSAVFIEYTPARYRVLVGHAPPDIYKMCVVCDVSKIGRICKMCEHMLEL